MDDVTVTPLSDAERSARNLATVVYGLQLLGVFLGGVPTIIGVIINYVKRDDVRGTLGQSHFRWQIRTFWFGLFWVAVCAIFVVLTLGIGILIAWLPLGLVGIWFIYRIIRGWLALSERRPMYS